MKPVIRERNGRYSALVELWHKGNRKTVSAGTHATEDAALRAGYKLVERYADSPEQKAAARSTQTLADWAASWLALLPGEVKASTVATYRWRMANWVLPGLGHKLLVEVTSGSVRLWLDSRPELSHRSRKAALSTLSAALVAAKERGLIQVNPCDDVKLKQSQAKTAQAKRVKTWTEEEARRLLAVEVGGVLAVLGLYGGLRRGEMLGLRWEDVDWLEGKLRICRNVVGTPEGTLWDETPKSGASRVVYLPTAAVTALALWRGTQGEEEARVVPLSPRQAQSAIERVSRAAGVPLLGCHSLRHTCASLLLSQGVSVVAVANHLGHSKPDITLRVYGHLMPQDAGKCAAALQSVLVTSPDQPRPVKGHPETVVASDLQFNVHKGVLGFDSED